jgi:predicted GTPase
MRNIEGVNASKMRNIEGVNAIDAQQPKVKNILIIGYCGSGNSSLVNTLLGENKAETSNSAPKHLTVLTFVLLKLQTMNSTTMVSIMLLPIL